MTTWDVFPFAWELDVLEIRLRTLADVVDIHVISESTLTHRGERKHLHLARWPERLQEFEHKIRYVTPDLDPGAWGDAPRVDFAANDDANWQREKGQRDALMAGLTDVADGDIVHLSDCDEIPHPRLFEVVQFSSSPMYRAKMPMHVGWLDRRWYDAHDPISRFMSGSLVKHFGVQGAREMECPVNLHASGWHLSYMGGVEAIQQKLAATAHSELDRPPFNTREWIEARLADGEDLFGRAGPRALPVDPIDLPPCVRDDPRRWAHLLADHQ